MKMKEVGLDTWFALSKLLATVAMWAGVSFFIYSSKIDLASPILALLGIAGTVLLWMGYPPAKSESTAARGSSEGDEREV
jgi:hypothetical protein